MNQQGTSLQVVIKQEQERIVSMKEQVARHEKLVKTLIELNNPQASGSENAKRPGTFRGAILSFFADNQPHTVDVLRTYLKDQPGLNPAALSNFRVRNELSQLKARGLLVNEKGSGVYQAAPQAPQVSLDSSGLVLSLVQVEEPELEAA